VAVNSFEYGAASGDLSPG